MSRIPFQLPDVGLREIRGKIFLDEEFLVFEVEDALMGEFDKEFQVIKVEPKALEEITLNRGFFRDQLLIRPKQHDLWRAMPGKYGTELMLKIWRKYRGPVEALVEEVKRRKRR